MNIELKSLKNKENKNKPSKKTILKSVLAVFMCLMIFATTLLGVYANEFLNKINYHEPAAQEDITYDPSLDIEEEINFQFDDYTIEEVTDITQLQTEEPTTKKETSSDKLEAIYKIEDGKQVEYVFTEEEMKQEAANIQNNADKDIQNNTSTKGDVWYSSDVYNLLIVGYDAGNREVTSFQGMKYSRSDCVIIASINKKKKTIKLVSLSRATYVAIEGHGNKRINAAYEYGGPKLLIHTIENNYKIKINNYIAVDFAGFEKLVDAMGGVTIWMTKIEAEFAFNKTGLKDGDYTLNGHQALRYVRLRKTDSDRLRTGRQRRVLKAMFKDFKKLSLTEDLEFLETALPFVTTDMSKAELVSKITEAQAYLNYKLTEDIIPHDAVKLSLRDGKEVLILDWTKTTDYAHKILYEGVAVKKTTPVKL